MFLGRVRRVWVVLNQMMLGVLLRSRQKLLPHNSNLSGSRHALSELVIGYR